MSALANKLVRESFSIYQELDQRGKPQLGREWTNFASIVQTDGKDKVEVICLATGTKCIGAGKKSPDGNLLNDSHAEILSRRLLLRYLYTELEQAMTGNVSIFIKDPTNGCLFCLKPSVHFHLVSTEMPCGDASIFVKFDTKRDKMDRIEEEKTSNNETASDLISIESSTESLKRKPSSVDCVGDIDEDHTTKKKKLKTNSPDQTTSTCSGTVSNVSSSANNFTVSNNSNSFTDRRTGAKCVAGGAQDQLTSGTDFHVAGALRVKPGRGDRTDSMSCSDKMMRWCVLGLQGGLLSNFLHPIFLSSVVITSEHFSHSSLERALSLRGRSNAGNVALHRPVLLHSTSEMFPHCEHKGKDMRPCGAALLWCRRPAIHEVTSVGKRHGITKKCQNSSKAWTPVCKRSLLVAFAKLLEKIEDLQNRFTVNAAYHDFKHACADYESRRSRFLTLFPDWSIKRKEMENFRP